MRCHRLMRRYLLAGVGLVSIGGVCCAFIASPTPSDAAQLKGDEPSTSSRHFISEEKYLKKKLARYSSFQPHPSGLKYRDLVEGDGLPVPDRNGIRVLVQYNGQTDDGRPVDTSADKRGGQGIWITLGYEPKQVVDGIDIAVRGMKPKQTRQLLVPPYLAFPLRIHQVLVYDVEVLRWEEPAEEHRKA